MHRIKTPKIDNHFLELHITCVISLFGKIQLELKYIYMLYCLLHDATPPTLNQLVSNVHTPPPPLVAYIYPHVSS